MATRLSGILNILLLVLCCILVLNLGNNTRGSFVIGFATDIGNMSFFQYVIFKTYRIYE